MINFLHRSNRLLSSAIAGLTAWIVVAGDLARSQEITSGPALFQSHDSASFRKLSTAGSEIDPNDFREELLSAAIFHETNKLRVEHKLPALALDEKVRAAAVSHAQEMAKAKVLTHGTPGQPQGGTTPSERLVANGLQPRFSAENVAFTFVLQYTSGTPIYTREDNGRPVYSYKPDGEPLPRHTYLSFAEAILTQWMNSAGHRANIVSTEPEFLGVGCALSRDPKGMDTIYANQNFFAPLPAPPVIPQP